MSFLPCDELTKLATVELNGDSAADYRALVAAGAPPSAFIELLARHCPPHLAERLREEFAELPLEIVSTVIAGWVMAGKAGAGFRVASVRPDRPLDFARRRLIRLSMEMDDEGVAFELSHVPGRHAAWYGAVAAAPAAA